MHWVVTQEASTRKDEGRRTGEACSSTVDLSTAGEEDPRRKSSGERDSGAPVAVGHPRCDGGPPGEEAHRRLLRDGQPHGTFELLELFSGAEHVGRPSSGMSGAIPLDLPVDRASWRAVITRDHPVTRWIRLDRASIEALSDLVTMGLAMGMGADLQAGDVHDIHWQFSVTSSSLILPRGLQQLRSVTYRRPYRLLAQPALPVEPDVFLDDLAALGLDHRTERTLREAVESFRRGLYLACASLLGATSEGARFAFGERFRASVPGLAKALDDGKASRCRRSSCRLSEMPAHG